MQRALPLRLATTPRGVRRRVRAINPQGQSPSNVAGGRGFALICRYMAKEFICMICDKTERGCSCNKYCGLCQSLFEVRLCQDGIYYCRPCREACDLQAQYKTVE